MPRQNDLRVKMHGRAGYHEHRVADEVFNFSILFL